MRYVQGLDKIMGKTTDTVHISLLICCWATYCLQFSCNPWNGLPKSFKQSVAEFYTSLLERGNLFLVLVSETGSMMFRSGDCAGQGRCLPSCPSSYN
jgi:hypothetical protein